MEVVCQNCKKSFDILPSKVRKGERKFCSKLCFAQGKANKISVFCEKCNKEFYVTPSRFRRGAGKHCSKKCFYENKPKPGITTVDKICINCEKTFSVKKSRDERNNVLYCSKKCRGETQTKKNCILKVCETCNQEFYNSLSKEKQKFGKFCSDKCRINREKERKEIVCVVCNNVFLDILSSLKKICSDDCLSIYNNRYKIVFNCSFCNKEVKKKPSLIRGEKNYCSKACCSLDKRKGEFVLCINCGKEIYKNPTSLKKYKNPFCSKECCWKFKVGENAPGWRGGVTSERKKQRDSKQYKEWRTQVFERDDYTCQNCKARNGNGKAVYLHAHHIKSFHNFPELRFELDNGVTLCIECHKETENYGGKAKKSTNI